MNAFKTLLAVSALTTIANVSHATLWDIEMNASVSVPLINGQVNMVNFTGYWDDASNMGSWTGTTILPSFYTTIHYTQTFTMDETTGIGTLNPHDMATCTSNTISACAGLFVSGTIRNTATTAASASEYKTAVAFSPFDGWFGQWTLQSSQPQTDEDVPEQFLPMNVCIRGWAACPAPQVLPIPSSAWMFSSGIIGLLTAVRRKFK